VQTFHVVEKGATPIRTRRAQAKINKSRVEAAAERRQQLDAMA
jgi:hypothetical protein